MPTNRIETRYNRSVIPHQRWRSARRRSNEKSARQVKREVVAARAPRKPAPRWSCPVDSMECQIRRQCTNKCGAKDVQP